MITGALNLGTVIVTGELTGLLILAVNDSWTLGTVIVTGELTGLLILAVNDSWTLGTVIATVKTNLTAGSVNDNWVAGLGSHCDWGPNRTTGSSCQ